ncbi:MAG TPA: bifunctional oligoribonuclease/PAP phosphatase NrnA [Acidimicrobiia bacterium]|nr:bifunctional oligoribonuclease/PAP phosphatase NrnA [Acidimicrobiia bacterium]
MRSDLAHAADVIRGARSVALACHVNPDGDALGSMLGLHHVLRGAGVDVVSSFSEPFTVAPHYRELPGLDLLTPPASFPTEPDVMITFDSGALSRLGDLERPAKAARELVVLDHHVSNDRYGSINVIVPDAAATGVVVRRLVDELDLALNADAAVCLYAALVCDTGRFQYETTTPEVFQLAAELVGYGVPVAKLSRTLFEEHSFAYLKLMAAALERAVLDADRSFVYTSVTRADLDEFGVSFGEIEGLIDVVRRTSEAEVSAVFKEGADGVTRVSMRSLGAVDVCRIAQSQGGGGHRFAAGFSTDDPVAEIVRRIESQLHE